MVKDDFVVPAVKREPASMHFVVLMPGAEIDGDPEITYLFAGICGAAARARWQCDSCKPQARQTTARIARRIETRCWRTSEGYRNSVKFAQPESHARKISTRNAAQ